MKQKIHKKEVFSRIAIIFFVILLAYFTDDTEKQFLNIIGFFLAFCASIIMHKHFVPWICFCTMCYLMAGLQEFYNQSYIYLPITKYLWTCGNAFLVIGIITFAVNLKFKFKIVENDTN